ncbi:MAG: hypothetical protein SFY66_04045 [Oculatellaceae cyanobacterium bins.114]|nr:hypothetical protein [Oculatellaceae cyanobacterium bins.114]
MEDHLLRLLDSINIACQNYLNGVYTLPDLQITIEGNASAIEIDTARASVLREIFGRFDTNLENIRFMYSGDEEYEAVSKEILDLKTSLSKISNS